MADIWLRSTDGNDGNAGTSKEAPKATLAAALTAAGAGGNVFASSLDAGSYTANVTLAFPGSVDNPTYVFCVADWGAATGSSWPTALADSATFTITSNNVLRFTGYGAVLGYLFSCANSGSEPIGFGETAFGFVFEKCRFRLTANSNSAMYTGNNSMSAGGSLEFRDCQVRFANALQRFTVRAKMKWTNRAGLSAIEAGGTLPTTLFVFGAKAGVIEGRGLDLSALGSGHNLFDVSGSQSSRGLLLNCKTGASVSARTGTIVGPHGVEIDLINCDSGDANYRTESHRYRGTIIDETTIVRSGGATNGTTPFSRKMVSAAAVNLFSPFVLGEIPINDVTPGSPVTRTIEIVNDGDTLTDKQIWTDVEYLGDEDFPISHVATSRAADNDFYLGSGANHDTSSVTWTTTGLSSPVKQKIPVTFTPELAGPYRIRVMLAEPSKTVYVCPQPSELD